MVTPTANISSKKVPVVPLELITKKRSAGCGTGTKTEPPVVPPVFAPAVLPTCANFPWNVTKSIDRGGSYTSKFSTSQTDVTMVMHEMYIRLFLFIATSTTELILFTMRREIF